MLTLQNICQIHPDGSLLFQDISFSVNERQKMALVGNNGAGKSTLLKMITGLQEPTSGQIFVEEKAHYVPQVLGQFEQMSVAQALGVDRKLKALEQILAGDATEQNFSTLGDDWNLEERCQQALQAWQLHDIDLWQPMQTLSGGQKTKVLFTAIIIHKPRFILLDEPSNHLDTSGRNVLYDFIQNTKSTLIVASHDRKLLNLLDSVCELSKFGAHIYGGNYDFYRQQKRIESNALDQNIENRQKQLKKAKKTEQKTFERQQKLDARAKKNLAHAGLPKIIANTRKNSAEQSSAKIAGVHLAKIDAMRQDLQQLRQAQDDIGQIKFGFEDMALHRGKILYHAEGLNFGYTDKFLWPKNLNFKLLSGQRITIRGDNGSGKTTFIRLLLGQIEPKSGKIYSSEHSAVYIDQDLSMLVPELTVYEQAQRHNFSKQAEHEVKTRLHQFLFTKDDWDKLCVTLSGGERMRLLLCCLTLHSKAPDIIILDEPTNNLDIQSIEILTLAVRQYQGTLLVISHDETFLEQIGINQTLQF